MKSLRVSTVFTSRILSNLVTFLLVLCSYQFKLPGVEYVPALPWAVAIASSMLFLHTGVLLGVLTGSISGHFLFGYSYPLTQSGVQLLLLNLISACCLSFSGYLGRKIERRSFSRRYFPVTMMIVVCLLGFLSINLENERIALVYFSASLIVSILSIVQNFKLDNQAAKLLFSWLPGYLIWIFFIKVFGLEPGYFHSYSAYLKKYLLIPLPVITLVLLVFSHLLVLLKKQEFNRLISS